MSIPNYLSFTVIAGCLATIVAAIVGVTWGLKGPIGAKATAAGPGRLQQLCWLPGL
jgi:hypothetical protein